MEHRLFDIHGVPVKPPHLHQYGAAPPDTLALKFDEPGDSWRWVMYIGDLKQLRTDRAPLAYTPAGLALIHTKAQSKHAAE